MHRGDILRRLFLLPFFCFLIFISAFAVEIGGSPADVDFGELSVSDSDFDSESTVSEDSEPSDLVDGSDTSELPDSPVSSVGDSDPLVIHADQVLISVDGEPEPYALAAGLEGGYYFSVSTSQLGDAMIFVPYEYQRGSFTLSSSGDLVSLRSSQVTGIMYSGSRTYNIRWSAFSSPEYRLYNSTGYSYSDLTVTDIKDTNVQILNNLSSAPLYPDTDLLLLVLIVLLGVTFVCLFIRL